MSCLDQDGPSGKLKFPIVVIRAQDFLIAGRLVSYEDVRRSGQHIVLDTLEQLKQFERKERIVFFSHQWTSYHQPDPSGAQYQTMIAALQKVQTAYRWPLERTFVWVE